MKESITSKFFILFFFILAVNDVKNTLEHKLWQQKKKKVFKKLLFRDYHHK